MVKAKIWIIMGDFFLLALALFSQEPVAKFERISVDQGLHQNIIMSIQQDCKGFLWIGTSDGLNRYDGYVFKLYKHDPNNPNSLPDNKIRSIYNDKSNTLWICTDGGISKYNRLMDSFINYRHDINNPASLSHNEVFFTFEDSEGILWVGTYGGGLNKFVEDKGFTHYKHNSDDPSSLSNNNVWTIYEDVLNRLWIGTEDGLNIFDRKKETFTCFRHNPHDSTSIINNSVLTIIGDKKGNVWIGTRAGLEKIESWELGKTRIKFTHYKIGSTPETPGKNNVQCLLEDKKGILWIGTNSGLKKLNCENGTIITYLSNPHDFYTTSHNYIYALYQDDWGELWIGTRGGGLNKLKLENKFNLYQEDPIKPGGLNHNVILSIYEDFLGELWIGTYDHGLNRFNKNRTQVIYYKNDPQNNCSIANNTIRSIFESRDHVLWLGTDNGIDKYDRLSNCFYHYPHDPTNPNSLSNNKIISRIYQDHLGKLWIGTLSGLNEFDPKKETFTRYLPDAHNPNSPNHLPAATIMAVIEEINNGKSFLWIGTYNGGLSLYDRQKKRFTHYRHDPSDPNSLSNDNVRILHIDKSGTLWVGTDRGLNKLNRATGKFIIYTEKEGQKNEWLANNSIYGILEDRDGNLWLSTLNGLSKFDPRREKFRNYDDRDGLQANEFSQGTYYKGRDGKFFFGGVNGFNTFYPENIKDNPQLPPVVITDFRIENKPVQADASYNHENYILLSKSITEMTETDIIRLDYKKNIFSFEFAALDFSIPGKNKYGYIMENLDKEWSYVNAGKRFVVYTNMRPAQYVFRVIASNSDGLWNEKGTAIKIIITPPVWQTWWFITIIIFLSCLLLFSGYLWRTRWLRKKLAEQERVQKLLTQSRDEMERSRDLAEFRHAENEKLITAISSVLIAVDNNGNIFQWNTPSEKFFGLKWEDAIGKSFCVYLENYISTNKLNEILQVGLSRDKSSNDLEISVYFRANNESRMLLANINPIIDKKGKKFGFLLLAEDITYRKKEEMQQYLSQKLEALGQMAAGIAHEIRSPLQYISDNGRFLLEAFGGLAGYCKEIRKSVYKTSEKRETTFTLEKSIQYFDENDFDFYVDEIPRAAEQIVDGVMRVSNIVKSINEFAHTGSESEVDEKSDLNELLKSALVVAQNRIDKVADLETQYTPGLPPIHCGMGELNQVFLNLLSNAADAVADSGKRGLIKIVTRRQDDESIVEISDNGVGIPDEIKGKLFTPFFTTKSMGQGTGQGLHFSYRIIAERYKGKLYFKSKINEGTTFYIHLPIEDELKTENENS